MKRIVILGGGTGGTIAANRLRRVYGTGEAEIIVVDQDAEHVYQPGLLFVPFGRRTPVGSSGPAAGSCTPGSGSGRPGSTTSTCPPTRSISMTGPCSATTRW
jgi:sulfide:quinone oxidoreductase